MRTIYVSARDVVYPLRLKELLGRDRVARFRPDEHPLGVAFRALEKQVLGLSGLTLHEARQLGRLNLMATELFSREKDWRAYERRLADHLSNAHECLSIEFELQVMQFALAKVEAVSWIRYSEGRPDIECSVPDLCVECKLLRVTELRRETLFNAIASAGRQHRGTKDVPIAVAVGFDGLLPPDAVEFIHRECQNRGEWFRQRPEVSAALVFLPKAIDQGTVESLGVPRVWLKLGDVIEVINHRASLPLPVGFSSAQ